MDRQPDAQQQTEPRAEPRLPAEERVFLTGAPSEVAALASKHGDKFSSGGVQAPPDHPLFTEPGLHAGSSPAQRAAASSSQAAEAQQAAAAGGAGGADAAAARQAGAGGAGGSRGSGGSGAATTAAAAEDGTDFVYGEVAECMDYASEEMDAE